MIAQRIGKPPDMQMGRNVMRKLMIAVAVTAGLGMLPVSAAVAADMHGKRHRHHVRTNPDLYVAANPAVRGGYIMNGNFDWRRIGERRPWYAHGYNGDCVAWTQDAYHYACDPNSRY
jgi:hypothetical protein